MLRKSVLPSIPDRQSSQEDTVTSNFESAVMRKFAWRLIPFLSIGYMINALDRFNVSMAALTMNKDLGLERFQPDWNKTRPRPSLVVRCYSWISIPAKA